MISYSGVLHCQVLSNILHAWRLNQSSSNKHPATHLFVPPSSSYKCIIGSVIPRCAVSCTFNFQTTDLHLLSNQSIFSQRFLFPIVSQALYLRSLHSGRIAFLRSHPPISATSVHCAAFHWRSLLHHCCAAACLWTLRVDAP